MANLTKITSKTSISESRNVIVRLQVSQLSLNNFQSRILLSENLKELLKFTIFGSEIMLENVNVSSSLMYSVIQKSRTDPITFLRIEVGIGLKL